MATPLLLDKTKELLNSTGADLTDIAIETSVTYDWLVKLKGNRIKDPSVNKVQAVYEYLSGKPLFSE